MFYLTGQIWLILLLATFAGLALGWWSRGLMSDIHAESDTGGEDVPDPFGARSRLEQCHRDNAALRRDLREAREQLEQRQRAEDLAQDGDVMARLQSADARVQALLDDLQARDDTIAVLERELEQTRTGLK